MLIDTNAFLGAYPYRRVPGTSPEAVVAAMDRVGIDEAWVSHLPGILWRDPTEGNPWLYRTCDRFPRLKPVPAVHPGLPNWQADVEEAKRQGAPAVRCDPSHYGLDPAGSGMRALVGQCGGTGMPLVLAVRLEDIRQRHPLDSAAELSPAAVRTLLRSDPRARLLITHADRGFIEEVHFGSTPEESARIWWDICWIWGPPEDHLEILLGTVGVGRFVFGTGMPLRIPENGLAKLDLLDLARDHRAAIESGNLLGDLLSTGSYRR